MNFRLLAMVGLAVVLSSEATWAGATGSPTPGKPPRGCSTTNLAKLPRLIRAAKGGEVCFVAKVYSVSDRIRLVDRRYEAGEDPLGVFLKADLAAYAGDPRDLRYGDVVRVTGRLSLERLCWEDPRAFCAPTRRPGTLSGGRIVKIASAPPGVVAPWEAAP